MVININSARGGWAKAGLLAALAACGGQDATTLSSTSGAQEPASPELSTPSDARSEPAGASAPAAPQLVQSEHVRTERQPDGSFASEVDATSMQSWVYFSLQSQQEVTPDSPEQSVSWDLGFQRASVKVNSGTSGVGSVRVAVASGPFEAVTQAPADGYIADAADADLDGSPDYAFGAGDGWYSYDPATHVLSARDTVFVVQTPTGDFKLQFSSYYDSAGTPGRLRFRWALLGRL